MTVDALKELIKSKAVIPVNVTLSMYFGASEDTQVELKYNVVSIQCESYNFNEDYVSMTAHLKTQSGLCMCVKLAPIKIHDLLAVVIEQEVVS